MNESPEKRLSPIEAYNVRQAIDAFVMSKAPLRSIAETVRQANAPGTSPFERYAGLVLHDAGAETLIDAPPSAGVTFIAPGAGTFARITCSDTAPQCVKGAAVDVENALNRLMDIGSALEFASLAQSQRQKRVSISFLGADYTPAAPTHRTAAVTFPELGQGGKPDLAFFNELDWRVLDHVASDARTVFQSCLKPNMHQALLGASAPDGSDWDLRTRLATVLSRLDLPMRTRFEFDVARGIQATLVAFEVPPVTSFPKRCNGSDASEQLEGARMGYALRLGCLAAAAGFGSGKHVRYAYVQARDADGMPLFEGTFERDAYVRSVLMALDEGTLGDSGLRFNPEALLEVILPGQFHLLGAVSADPTPEIAAHSGKPSAPDIAERAREQRKEPWRDERELPARMQALFCATRICDIDTSHYLGSSSELIDEARSDADESSLAAIARLEHVVQTQAEKLSPPAGNPEARPLYCGNALARAALPLLRDELTVGSDAEAFLAEAAPSEEFMVAEQAERFLASLDAESARSDEAKASTRANRAATAGHPTFYRAPSALFHAHIGLSDLYQRIGDVNGAIAHADYCIGLAPTTAGAYFRKADVLAEEGRYAEAGNVLTAGLRTAIAEQDCALLYYHLALVLTHMGRANDAAAIQVYTASLAGEFAQRANDVVAQLRKRKNAPVIAYASPIAAAREMIRAGIIVAPGNAARALVAQAALGLSNAEAPLAAAPYVGALASYLPADPVLSAVYRALKHGIKNV